MDHIPQPPHTTSADDISAIPPTKAEVLQAVKSLIEGYEGLPPGAMLTPVTHYDLHSVLLLLSAALRAS